MIREITLDTETTGLCKGSSLGVSHGHRIIEIGCIELIDRKFTGRQFHVYLNPEMEVTAEASKINGYTLEMLKDKPKFSDIARYFLQFIYGAHLVIHNAKFDLSFIRKELAMIGKEAILNDCISGVICTLEKAKMFRPYPQKNSLDTLCQLYGIDNSKREVHGALLDANLLAQVYLAMTANEKPEIENKIKTKSEKLISHLDGLIEKHKSDESVVLVKEIKSYLEKL